MYDRLPLLHTFPGPSCSDDSRYPSHNLYNHRPSVRHSGSDCECLNETYQAHDHRIISLVCDGLHRREPRSVDLIVTTAPSSLTLTLTKLQPSRNHGLSLYLLEKSKDSRVLAR